MECPNCHIRMNVYKLESEYRFDKCSQCSGMWFDLKQLNNYVDKADPDLTWMDIDFWKDDSHFRVTADSKVCPECKVRHLTRVTDISTDTTAAFCDRCRGIWLETEQLRHIVEMVKMKSLQMSSADYITESLGKLTHLLSPASSDMAGDWQELKVLLRLLHYRIFAEHPKLASMILGVQKSILS